MRISFHGAAGEVTGSCHLLEAAGKKILIDCGMFQGPGEIDEANAAPFGFDPREIDKLILTHGHLDHCGRIPLLVARGFRGEIITTSATRDLARLVMLDAANVEAEDARRRRRHGATGPLARPLYDEIDVLDALEHFGRKARLGRPIRLGRGLTATFHEAGHILGSGSVMIEAEEKGKRRKILFSGDIGPHERPFLNPPAPPHGADYIVTETTYGDRDHKPLAASIDEFYTCIDTTHSQGGNVVIPTFALERAQELLWFLREGEAAGRIDHRPQIFLDSPMAISATRIFRRHPEALARHAAKLIERGVDAFDVPGLAFTREVAQSKAINEIRSGALIMAGSGMCTGGRIRHHLRHNISRPECAIVFVGYAAEGTLGREIIDGAPQVEILGEVHEVRARIYTINGFSAHAGRSDLLAWLKAVGKPRRTFLVHGDPGKGMAAMHETLSAMGWHPVRPAQGEVFELD